jgi:flagellar assembly protein FliH
MSPVMDVPYRRLEYRPLQSPEESGGPVSDTGNISPEPHAVTTLREKLQETEARLAEALHNHEHWMADAEERALNRGREQVLLETKEEISRVGSLLLTALEGFCEERDKYFGQVEQEVVRLALGIAARILHRESQIDPLLLAGAVRVALGQLADNTGVTLRVPATDHAMWEETLRLMPNLPLRPSVVGDPDVGPEMCILETRLGSVDLGVRAQLAEIERGFFDLLEQRPRALADGKLGESGLTRRQPAE